MARKEEELFAPERTVRQSKEQKCGAFHGGAQEAERVRSINSARASSSSSSPVECLYEPTAAANEDAGTPWSFCSFFSFSLGCVLWPEPCGTYEPEHWQSAGINREAENTMSFSGHSPQRVRSPWQNLRGIRGVEEGQCSMERDNAYRGQLYAANACVAVTLRQKGERKMENGPCDGERWQRTRTSYAARKRRTYKGDDLAPVLSWLKRILTGHWDTGFIAGHSELVCFVKKAGRLWGWFAYQRGAYFHCSQIVVVNRDEISCAFMGILIEEYIYYNHFYSSMISWLNHRVVIFKWLSTHFELRR